MYREFKKLSFKRVRIQLLESLIFIAILLIAFGSSLLSYFNGPIELDTLPISELKGSYVNTDIYAIVDVFAEYTVEDDYGDSKITKSYYIIPVGEAEYMALEVKTDESYTGMAEQIYDETYEFLMGERETLDSTLAIEGSINPLEGELYELYSQWFIETGFLEGEATSNIEDIALPYLLQIDYVGKYDVGIVAFVFIAIFLIIVYDIILLLLYISGVFLLPAKGFIKQNQDSLSLEQVEEDFKNATAFGNITFLQNEIRIGRYCTYYLKRGMVHIINNNKLNWVYLEKNSSRLYGLKIFSVKQLTLRTIDRKRYRIIINRESDIHQAIDVLIRNNPEIVAGYSDDRLKLWKKNMDEFMKLSYNNYTPAEEKLTPTKFNKGEDLSHYYDDVATNVIYDSNENTDVNNKTDSDN